MIHAGSGIKAAAAVLLSKNKALNRNGGGKKKAFLSPVRGEIMAIDGVRFGRSKCPSRKRGQALNVYESEKILFDLCNRC